MDSSTLTPLWAFALASLTTMWAFSQRERTRVLLLVPIWLLSFLSLKTCHRLAWSGGFSSTYASLLIFYFLHSLKILLLDYQPPKSLSPVDSYKLWNNPRGLSTHTSSPTRSSAKSHLKFALKQFIKIVLLFMLDTYAIQGVISTAVFTEAKPSDFAPQYELFLFQPLSSKQLLIRAAISVSWIWTAFYLLTASHCVLSLVFVALLRWDEPEEWPSIWGHPANATSVRDFWGKVWNGITIPTFAFYAHLVLTTFGVEKQSRLGKKVVPFVIFFLSGLSHSLAGWTMGDVAPGRDMLFFMLNFLACAAETWVGKTRQWKIFKRRIPPWVLKVAGVIYLFGFFFTAVPLWMYPKVYGALGF
ncbi:hypothetical protein QBC36DRAFT_354396 [Triangularia setosa]|uniref:Wax synthase domain-containing protein n=1 Tax=Triangularia setosa TaxID=2587417 RepID=A0AAN6W5I3_9PEZI|nr:hypothetical protein QBC36DRAFT_354396 [Podospora setosa]